MVCLEQLLIEKQASLVVLVQFLIFMVFLYDKLASYGLPIHLANDANCVGFKRAFGSPN